MLDDLRNFRSVALRLREKFLDRRPSLRHGSMELAATPLRDAFLATVGMTGFDKDFKREKMAIRSSRCPTADPSSAKICAENLYNAMAREEASVVNPAFAPAYA